MNCFENALKHVKMTEEEFLSIYNLPDAERTNQEEELRHKDYNKYGDYIHLLVAYKKLHKN